MLVLDERYTHLVFHLMATAFVRPAKAYFFTGTYG